jgi:malate dehydrogenase
MIAAIVGAGDLGGTLASMLATRNRLQRVLLIDESGSVAAGKALDIQQATALQGGAVRIEGQASFDAAAGAPVVVLADASGAPCAEWQGEPGLELLRRLIALSPRAVFVCAGARQATLVERAVSELGVAPSRVAGSAPAAFHASVRMLIGLEAGAEGGDISIAITGVPPDRLVIAWESATADGERLDRRLDAAALRRVRERLVYLWPPGPIALATAATSFVEAFVHGSHRSHSAFVAAEGPRGREWRVAAMSATIGPMGIERTRVPALSTQEQLAFENAWSR